MGDKDPYQYLLGIYQEFENYVVIYLKKEIMNFEVHGVWVIQTLDPYQGLIFIEPMDNVEKPNLLDQMYHITTRKREDYINLTVVGSISQRSFQSTKVGSNVVMGDWNQGGHELHYQH